MSDLLPCPFCGGKPYTRETQDEDLSTHAIVTWKFVGCHNCDVSFGIPDGYDCGTASEQWNTRSDHVDALLKAEREKALREALDIIGMYDENSTCSECCDVTAINEAVTALISKDETDG